MEFSMEKFNISCSEIFIPLENTMTSSNVSSKFDSIDDLLSFTINDFRSIIFQNELLRFFLVLKFNDNKYIDDFVETINVKTTVINNSTMNDEDDIEYNTSLNSFCNITTELNDNSMMDKITQIKKLYDKQIVIIEVNKHIIVPNSYVNNNLSLKVSLIRSNSIYTLRKSTEPKFNLNDFSIFNINDKKIYKTTTLFSVYKNIKVVRPLYVSQTKQLDTSTLSSILQIKIENITSTVNFIDNEIKTSAFINYSNDFDNNVELVNYGIDFMITNIDVLKDETIIDNKMTMNIDKGEQYHQHYQLPIAINAIEIEVINHQFPIVIKPGEEYNIAMKLIKRKDTAMKTISSIEEENIITSMNTNKNKRESFFSRFSKGKKETLSSLLPSKRRTSGINEEPIDQIIKLSMNTPIILSISPNEGKYRNMYMKINLKWKSDIENMMSIKYIIDNTDNLTIGRFFTLEMIFTNLSSKVCEYNAIFNDSFDDIKINSNELICKKKIEDNLPDIISEHNHINIGSIAPKESKSIAIRFIGTKSGFISLPSFHIVDNISLKTFFVVHTNRIYINDDI